MAMAMSFEKRISDPPALSDTQNRLSADVEGSGVPQADFIIEAIFEDRDAKQALYRDLEPRMKSSAILAVIDARARPKSTLEIR